MSLNIKQSKKNEKHARINRSFLIENAKYFQGAMAMYLYAKIIKGQQKSKQDNFVVGFDLEVAATHLNLSRRTMYYAYNECLDKNWFFQISRTGYWVNVLVKF